MERQIPREELCHRIAWTDLAPGPLQSLIRSARAEDLFGTGLRQKPRHRGDVTSRTLAGGGIGHAELRAREPLVACGLHLGPMILAAYGSTLTFAAEVSDGTAVKTGARLARVTGPARKLLEAERVLLNFLQHLSGIATNTARHVRALGNSRTCLLDTRKTTPGLRLLEKHAVACGGGWNHRLGLFDRILVKDNHLAAAAATRGARLAAAVARARQRAAGLIVEVEVDAIGQLPPVLEAGADIVLLDNFRPAQLRRAVAMCEGRAYTEASGGITLRSLPRLGRLGLDFISSGALVHQSTWVDIGLDWRE